MNEELTFKDFKLSEDTFESITKKGFTQPSEVQAKVIPVIFERNKDIIAIAQTGTGKTGAFGLPIVDLIEENNKTPKVIILAPTRELAIQVTKELSTYSTNKRLRLLTVYGGAAISTQIKELKRGVDIVVGTPGRVVDMIKRNALGLKAIDYFILDEADEMLNMGFIEDLEFILSKTSSKKRVYLFSATMPKQIRNLSKKYMKNQVEIEIETKSNIHSELIDQVFYRVERSGKTEALMKIIDSNDFFYGIVFCKTKSEVNKLTSELKRNNYEADCIHGDVVQNKREKILQKFRDMKIHILVATDVAARGIDVNNLTHVVNHSLPQAIETYVHRIGRTGRAGNKGTAVTLLTTAEMRRLSFLEKTTGFQLRKAELPKESEIREKNKTKTFDEYKKIIEEGNHKDSLELAKELIEKYGAEELVAALLHKGTSKKIDKSNDNDDRDEGRRSFKKSGKDRRWGNKDRNSSRGGKSGGYKGNRDKKSGFSKSKKRAIRYNNE